MLPHLRCISTGYTTSDGDDDDDDILNPKMFLLAYKLKLSLNFYCLNIDTRDFSLILPNTLYTYTKHILTKLVCIC